MCWVHHHVPIHGPLLDRSFEQPEQEPHNTTHTHHKTHTDPTTNSTTITTTSPGRTSQQMNSCLNSCLRNHETRHQIRQASTSTGPLRHHPLPVPRLQVIHASASEATVSTAPKGPRAAERSDRAAQRPCATAGRDRPFLDRHSDKCTKEWSRGEFRFILGNAFEQHGIRQWCGTLNSSPIAALNSRRNCHFSRRSGKPPVCREELSSRGAYEPAFHFHKVNSSNSIAHRL